MPTGYTSDIKDGITFERFIMNCARGFDALITMRDDPSDAEIPTEFLPTDYHINKLAELQPEFEHIKTLTVEEAAKEARDKYDEKIVYNQKKIKENNNLKQKYEAMLSKAKNWQPPTSDHQGLKDFMIEQILSSIDFDCFTEYYRKPVELLTGEQWISKETQRLLKEIVYHEEAHQAEVKNVDRSNKWVKELRDSL